MSHNRAGGFTVGENATISAYRRDFGSRRPTVDDVANCLTATPGQSEPDFVQQLSDQQMLHDIQAAALQVLPAGAVVSVLGTGDDALPMLDGCTTSHFPWEAAEAGPTDALERLRFQGTGFLVVPRTSFPWFEQQPEFRGHLRRTYRLAYRADDTCWIFDLGQPSPWAPLASRIEDFSLLFRRLPAILDWYTGAGLAEIFPECTVFAPPGRAPHTLPYLTRSIDIVAADDSRADEAHRVASVFVVRTTPCEPDANDCRITIESVRRP